MKTKFLMCLLLIVLFVTGCSSNVLEGNKKRLVCSQKVSVVDIDMIADFSGNTLDYLGLKYTMDLSSYTDDQIKLISNQNMCSSVKDAMTGYTDAFTNCKHKIEGKALILTADFDIDKVSGSDISKDTTIDVAKTALEKQNYTCTVSNK